MPSLACLAPQHFKSRLSRTLCAGLLLCLDLGALSAAPLIITIPKANSGGQVEFGQGSSVAPDGGTLTADACSLLLNGSRLMPIAGEFHYSRYPREEWRTQLLRMKADGITVVSTYVFWIHHQEEPGDFDWSDRRDLRHFVSLCGELGLKAVVRIGPWAHGEVRNGGLPDWVEKSGTKLRSADPAFLALVRPFFTQIATQLDGLYWKNGGPIIAIQIENECDGPEYLLTLKRLARELGLDAPLYTMTGWNGVRIPEAGLLPLFGSYSIAFWYPYSRDTYKKSFFHTDIRDDGDMGAQFTNTRPQRVGPINRFPYICCEIGGGMPSSYTKRVKVDPDEIGAMALVKLGNGSNMPGYYMYQGGINPDGRLSQLHEARPNAMPVKDYDFQAPLGAAGLARPQAGLLRRQHLFIAAHASTLARQPLVLPEQRPTSIQDVDTVRWALRDDGVSGFLFLNNYQPLTRLPAHLAQQFLLKRPGGEQLVPATPIDIPSGTYGVLPVNLRTGTLLLRYATVDSLGTLSVGSEQWVFLGEIAGLRPELAVDLSEAARLPAGLWHAEGTGEGKVAVVPLHPARTAAFSLRTTASGTVHFVVLPAADAVRLHRVSLQGRDTLALSPATLLADGNTVILESRDPAENQLEVFSPPPPSGDTTTSPLFRKIPLQTSLISAGHVQLKPVSTPELHGSVLDGRVEGDWDKCPVWRIELDKTALGDGHRLLSVAYKGEAARVYAGGRLLLDNYFNGEALELPLWRIPAQERSQLTLRIIPLAADADKRLPPVVAESLAGRPEAPAAKLVPIHHAEARF